MLLATIYSNKGEYKIEGYNNEGEFRKVETTPEAKPGCQIIERLIDNAKSEEVKQLEEKLEMTKTEKEAAKLEAEEAKKTAAATIEQLKEVLNVFPEWKSGQYLQPGEYRHYENTIYKYIGKEYYKTIATETPDVSDKFAKAMPETYDIKPIEDYIEGEIYNAGDRVMFKDGHVYASLADGNKWPPSVTTAPWELIK